MEFQEDWRVAFPSVNAANHFQEQADAYLARLPAEADGVASEIEAQAWAPDFALEGVPQPAVDEVRSLFERAGEALREKDVAAARGLLEDVIAYCTPS